MKKISVIKFLANEYGKRKREIKSRIREFKSIGRSGADAVFKELCFCLMTANANALECDQAIRDIMRKRLLWKGRRTDIAGCIKGRVRFHNKKARFLIGARSVFRDHALHDRIRTDDVIALRQWLVENINGLGYKEASHFLRNVGLGKDIAILDRHILKNLKKYGVIRRIPSSVGARRVYMAIEDKMRRFSGKVRIPFEHLDLLFWSIETGFVFR